jgi:hypothetical protein
MPVKIVSRGTMPNPHYSLENQCDKTIRESNKLYEERVSQLLDEEGYTIASVLENKDEGFTSDPIFILKLKVEPKIVSVKTVDNNDVDQWLNEGYEVEAINAKTTNLIKKEVPHGDHIDAILQTKKIAEESFGK